MYIVISGEVCQWDGLHPQEIEGQEPDHKYQELMTWGEEAMTTDLLWEATTKALRKTLVLTLQRRDLIEVLSHVKVMQSSDKQSFLIKSQFLDELTYNRVLEFNNLLQEQRFNPGEIIYDQGAESDTFFVAKRGKLSIQAIVEIEDRNIYPHSGDHIWKMIETKKRVIYKVRDIVPGEVFGHDELIEHFENVSRTGEGQRRIPTRRYRVVAQDRADVFFINVAKFYYFFNDVDLGKLRHHIVTIDMDEIRHKVTTFFLAKRINQQSILDAMKVNQVAVTEGQD